MAEHADDGGGVPNLVALPRLPVGGVVGFEAESLAFEEEGNCFRTAC